MGRSEQPLYDPGQFLEVDSISSPEDTNRFRVESLIGHGAFAELYNVFDIKTQQNFAVKVEKNRSDGLSKLQKEAEIHKLLSKKLNQPVLPPGYHYVQINSNMDGNIEWSSCSTTSTSKNAGSNNNNGGQNQNQISVTSPDHHHHLSSHSVSAAQLGGGPLKRQRLDSSTIAPTTSVSGVISPSSSNYGNKKNHQNSTVGNSNHSNNGKNSSMSSTCTTYEEVENRSSTLVPFFYDFKKADTSSLNSTNNTNTNSNNSDVNTGNHQNQNAQSNGQSTYGRDSSYNNRDTSRNRERDRGTGNRSDRGGVGGDNTLTLTSNNNNRSSNHNGNNHGDDEPSGPRGAPFIRLELMGRDLSKVRKTVRLQKVSMCSVGFFGKQLIEILRRVHSEGILHRDIKPQNLMLGNSQDSKLDLRLVDFGLARDDFFEWKLKSKQPLESVSFRGTAAYASLNSLENIEQGKRDDLEGVFWVFIDLLWGGLPWRRLNLGKSKERDSKIKQGKSQIFDALEDIRQGDVTLEPKLPKDLVYSGPIDKSKKFCSTADLTGHELLEALPTCMVDYLKKLSRLGWSEVPDYDFFAQCFERLEELGDTNAFRKTFGSGGKSSTSSNSNASSNTSSTTANNNNNSNNSTNSNSSSNTIIIPAKTRKDAIANEIFGNSADNQYWNSVRNPTKMFGKNPREEMGYNLVLNSQNQNHLNGNNINSDYFENTSLDLLGPSTVIRSDHGKLVITNSNAATTSSSSSSHSSATTVVGNNNQNQTVTVTGSNKATSMAISSSQAARTPDQTGLEVSTVPTSGKRKQQNNGGGNNNTAAATNVNDGPASKRRRAPKGGKKRD